MTPSGDVTASKAQGESTLDCFAADSVSLLFSCSEIVLEYIGLTISSGQQFNALI